MAYELFSKRNWWDQSGTRGRVTFSKNCLIYIPADFIKKHYGDLDFNSYKVYYDKIDNKIGFEISNETIENDRENNWSLNNRKKKRVGYRFDVKTLLKYRNITPKHLFEINFNILGNLMEVCLNDYKENFSLIDPDGLNIFEEAEPEPEPEVEATVMPIRNKNITKEEESTFKKIQALIKKGLKVPDIAVQIGLSKSHIYKIIKRNKG